MKNFILIFATLLGFADVTHAQNSNATINIDAGLLENSTGTAVVANGMLLQILASPSGTFSAPTSNAYVTGDNILLGNFAMNSNSGVSGETLTDLTFSLTTYNLTVGEALELRFYPSLSATSMPTSPTLGTTYGQVRSNTTEPGQTDGSQAAWVVPSVGSTVDLLYITANVGGSYSNASADATNMVLAGGSIVPEPSIYALFTGALVGLLSLRLWNRRYKALFLL